MSSVACDVNHCGIALMSPGCQYLSRYTAIHAAPTLYNKSEMRLLTGLWWRRDLEWWLLLMFQIHQLGAWKRSRSLALPWHANTWMYGTRCCLLRKITVLCYALQPRVSMLFNDGNICTVLLKSYARTYARTTHVHPCNTKAETHVLHTHLMTHNDRVNHWY